MKHRVKEDVYEGEISYIIKFNEQIIEISQEEITK